MFDEITDEMIERLPEDQRDVWIQLRDRRKEAEQLIFTAIVDGDWQTALTLTGSEGRAAVMIALGDALNDDQVRQMLIDYWDITEAWSGDPELRDGMYDLLARAGRIVDDLPEGESFTVYRGNLGERPGTGSWTLDPETAAFFSRMANSLRGAFLGMKREGGVPTVWRARVERAKVLAYFAGRDEQEVVVNGDDLTEIEEATV